MDDIEYAIKSYHTFVVNCLNDKQLCKHNHPPITMLEVNCLYCKKYGNVFANGIVHQSTELNAHIIPFQPSSVKSLQ
tara:strand:+ start:26 stop:256 length:231 start_codon:yes stop_codon:yes gene_type:complete